MRIVNTIKSIRERESLTQQQAADALGWTLRRWQSYEQSTRLPSVREALLIAEILKAKVEELWRIERGGK